MANLRLLRLSLVVVWLATGVISLVELRGQSTALLLEAGLTDNFWIDLLIYSGAGLDALLGLAMWWAPRPLVYWLALLSMCAMTAVATVLMPALWLHPLGPLLKNIPLAAMLHLLIHRDTP